MWITESLHGGASNRPRLESSSDQLLAMGCHRRHVRRRGSPDDSPRLSSTCVGAIELLRGEGREGTDLGSDVARRQ